MSKFEDCKKCEDRKECEDPQDFWHRGCRLRHAFPDATTKKDGLLFFDLKKIRKQLEEKTKERD